MVSNAFCNSIHLKRNFIFGEFLLYVQNLFNLLFLNLFLCFSKNLLKSFLFRFLCQWSNSHNFLVAVSRWSLRQFNVFFHICWNKTIFYQFFSIHLVESTKGGFWSCLISLWYRNMLKIYDIHVFLLSLIFFEADSDLIGGDSCWFCSSFLLSFGSTFLFCPLKHFLLNELIFCYFPCNFVAILDILMDSLGETDFVCG